MAQRRWCLRFVLALVLGASGAAAAGCASGGVPPDSGSGGTDARVDAPVVDTGTADAPTDAPPTDAPPATCTPRCEGLRYCLDGTCVDYPECRRDRTCPDAGDICIMLRCIPATDDVDGDGSPASEDCDELDPNRYPGAPEICNNADENCNGTNDDGDPAVLCEGTPEGGICISGACGCPAGTHDFDRTVSGCECTDNPGPMMAETCDTAIDVGMLPDSGSMMNVTGNAIGREVWYRVRAVDAPETAACDNFYFRAQLTSNPGDVYEIEVTRGVCGNPPSCAAGGAPMIDYSWATDFRAIDATGVLAGQCPCDAAAPMTTDVSACADDSADFFVVVRRVAGAALDCSSFTLELSNGVYDTPP